MSDDGTQVKMVSGGLIADEETGGTGAGRGQEPGTFAITAICAGPERDVFLFTGQL
uniref:Uncharacterized protein n=1 Tax=Anguilla anguilla TaxID=7936 RepID=A0A0E9P9X5_ANGAN